MGATSELAILIRARDDASKVFAEVSRASEGLMGRLKSLGKAGFLALGAAAVIGGGALLSFAKDASTLGESISKVNVVFGQNAKEVQDWAKGSAVAFGQSRQQALEAAGTYGNLFRSFGVGRDETKKMSMSLVELAADLASFNNTSVDDAILALRSGLSGETEPLKRFGVAINDARLRDEALRMGLIATTKDALTPGAKAQAAYALVMHDTALAQGDFARTSDGLANQQRILSAVWADTKASLGQILLPLLTAATKALGAFLTDHQADIQRFSEWMSERIPDAIEKVSNGLQRARDIVEPFWDSLDQKDKIAILIALAAVIAGPLVAAMVAFAAAQVLAFATNPITVWIVAIGAVSVALTLLVRHWDSVWPAMKAAPSELLAWLRDNWITALLITLGPAGWGVILLRNWSAVWERMPSPVQSAMNAVAGVVERVVQFILDRFGDVVHGIGEMLGALRQPGLRQALDQVGITADLVDKLKGFQPATVNLQQQGGGGASGNGLGRFADGQFARAVADTGKAAGDALPSILDLETGLGGGGGAGGGLSAAAKEAQQDLIELALKFADFHAATGLGEQDFLALIKVTQDKAELDRRATQAGIDLKAAQLEATDAGFQLRKGLVEVAEHMVKTGATITEVFRDAARKVHDSIQSAFGDLFSRPTRESAEMQLRIDELQRQRIEAQLAGASKEKLKHLDEEIERLELENRLREANIKILQDKMTLADQTLLTDQQQLFAAQLYIIALANQSVQLKALTDQAGLESIYRYNMMNAMNEYAAALRSGASGVATVPSFSSGTAFVPATGLAMVHRGERIIPADQNRAGAGATQHIYVQTVEIHGDPAAGLSALGVGY